MRLRLFLPRSRGRAGLRGIAQGAVALLGLLWLCGCGSGSAQRSTTSAPPAPLVDTSPAPPAPAHAFGITEDDAALLWDPASGPPASAPVLAARRALSALHPAYVRLLVDWAALQPDPARAPALESSMSGCARTVAPCDPYDGIAAELRAIASQQRAVHGDGYRVVVDVYGTPAWAAAAPSGCEDPATPAFARPPGGASLGAYRALVGSLLALAEREGVALEWWSPWNEPNDPRFLSPQRAACAAGSEPSAAASYARLALAMEQALRAHAGTHHLVLGELNDFGIDTPHTTSIRSFIAALPQPVICLAGVWSVHAYVRHAPAAAAPDAVGALESALDARGSCGARARVWVSEAGAGAPRPGRPRSGEAGEEQRGCEALAAQLARWRADPRLAAVLQYSFREDPDFPVGLINAPLTHLYRTYSPWAAFARASEDGRPLPSPARACA